MSDVCKDCHSFQIFKEKCWFFWENKRACSQFRSSPNAEPTFVSVEHMHELLRAKN